MTKALDVIGMQQKFCYTTYLKPKFATCVIKLWAALNGMYMHAICNYIFKSNSL